MAAAAAKKVLVVAGEHTFSNPVRSPSLCLFNNIQVWELEVERVHRQRAYTCSPGDNPDILTDSSLSSRLFSKAGYTVALIARGADTVEKLKKELTSTGAEVSFAPSIPAIQTNTRVGGRIPRRSIHPSGHR
jgi:hypothetical protein